MNLSRLLDGCRRGEEAAWEEFLRRFGDRLRYMACSALGSASHPQPDDVVQEVLLRLLRYLPTLNPTGTGQLVNYLKRTVRSVVSEEYRRRSASKRTRRESNASPPEAPDPEKELLRREGYRRLLGRLASGRYPERALRIVQWKVVEGRTSQEIAAAVGMTPSGVDSALCRILKRHREDRSLSAAPCCSGRKL